MPLLRALAAEASVRGFRGPLVEALLSAQSPRSIEELPPHLRELAERYRRAVADVLGVPPEAIREDVVVRWVTHWAEAYVKPEYRHLIKARLGGMA